MKKQIIPEYIFETSWEVCNMVGGIYTVLSTKARTLYDIHGDKLIFIGPDVWRINESPYFEPSEELLAQWCIHFNSTTGLKIRIGRWKIPGKPIAVLVDFTHLFLQKNEIYGHMWELFGVDSLHAYGDYDESSMFGYASGIVMESYYRYHKLNKKHSVVAHFNEWMTTFGAFYIRNAVPEIATLFTTHATSIGRSIAGNHKPLYEYLQEYDGDQMAIELNIRSKHSTEKMGARIVDCFTTVSDITAAECEQLLDKKPDIVTPNGFEDDFVPSNALFRHKRVAARKCLKKVAETLFGHQLQDDAVFIATAGRYEYKNKGLDVFIESMKKLCETYNLAHEVVVFIVVPAHIAGARTDLMGKLLNPAVEIGENNKLTTHNLYNSHQDSILNALQWFHFRNQPTDKVKIVFIPSYLNGQDGIFNLSYWDVLIGMDLTVFPSYYEPWGYTPLESIAFSVPTITTDLSGFGQWAKNLEGHEGVTVVHRSDYNNHEVVEAIASAVNEFVRLRPMQTKKLRKGAWQTSQKALWSKFIQYYYDAYRIALKNKDLRNHQRIEN